MNIRKKTAYNLPDFISQHVAWEGLNQSPEWRAFTDAWQRGETTVAVVALDVLVCQKDDKLTATESALICSVADSLRQAMNTNPSAA